MKMVHRMEAGKHTIYVNDRGMEYLENAIRNDLKMNTISFNDEVYNIVGFVINPDTKIGMETYEKDGSYYIKADDNDVANELIEIDINEYDFCPNDGIVTDEMIEELISEELIEDEVEEEV